MAWMKRTSAPPSRVSVATVWRKRWQEPSFLERGYLSGDLRPFVQPAQTGSVRE